jgi:hypothetical protein
VILLSFNRKAAMISSTVWTGKEELMLEACDGRSAHCARKWKWVKWKSPGRVCD